MIAAVVDLAKDVAAEGRRGQRFQPPLTDDELAFFDAVARTRLDAMSHGLCPQVQVL